MAAWSSQSGIVVKERTDLEKTRFTLKWTINDFEKLRKKSECFTSVGITMWELGRDDFPGRWRICVQPCITTTEEGVKQSYVGAFLRLTDVDVESLSYTGDKFVDAEFVISVSTGKEATVIATNDLLEHTFGVRKYSKGSSTLVSHEELFGDIKNPGLLKDDSLTVVIEGLMYGEPKAANSPDMVTADSSKWCQLFVQRRAEDPRLQSTDFTIRSSDGQLFPTYRELLTSHSPVFAAMLSNDTKENRLSRCELEDVDGETVGVLLGHVYGCAGGKITVSSAEKVLIMADQYGVVDLRAKCEDILARSVTGANAVHYLVLASQRKLIKLKKAALNGIPYSMGTVLKNGALQEALQFDPELMQTIMEHCSKEIQILRWEFALALVVICIGFLYILIKLR